MTLDELFLELTERGLVLHYLRGPEPSGAWECSILQPINGDINRNYVGWGKGRSPIRAVESAMEALERHESIETFVPDIAAIDKTPAPSLLTQLGLITPDPPMVRRV